MDKAAQRSAPLSPVSSFFTPSPPSLWNEAKKDDESGCTRVPISWGSFQKALREIVKGHDYALIEEALAHAKELSANGVHPSVNEVIVSAMSSAGAFSAEKMEWLAKRGHDIRPTLESSQKDHATWAGSHSDSAFDWAFASPASLPDSLQRAQVLKVWLGAVIKGHAEYAKGDVDITLWTSRRVEAIEDARPGIVREWLSKLPKYGAEKEIKPEERAERDGLSLFFTHLLLASCPEKLADWLDPGRYGHPASANILMETAVRFSFKNTSSTGRVQTSACSVWSNLSRALEIRPAARKFWEQQTRPGKLSTIEETNRPSSLAFPSQEHVFEQASFGRNNYYQANKSLEERRFDLTLPMDPLGRLLGSNDDYISHVASTPHGRSMIIESMKSHPAFMVYGFGRFGEDLLRWDEATALEGFRDVYGYGAARYLLATCNRVASVFDVALHRCLRQRKGICDNAQPILDSLFVEPANRAKYMSMELKKAARSVTKEVPRQPPPAAPRRMM